MGEATKESEVGMEERSSQNKQEKHPFFFPPLFILIAVTGITSQLLVRGASFQLHHRV